MVAVSARAEKAAAVGRLLACIALAANSMVGGGCARYLSQFTDEDREIVLNYVGDNSSTMQIDANGGFITVQFYADRYVNYSVRYGADCTSGTLAQILPQSGFAGAGDTVSVRMNYSELMANSGSGIICVADKAAYKKTSLVKTFSTSAINSYVTQYNETYGASGTPLSTGQTSEYELFQVEQASPSWSNNLVNRDGGTTKQNGVSFNYGMVTAIDVNDGYKLKLLVIDRNNNRVLVFNSIPTSNAASPDVVIGQADFVTGTAGITQQNFDQPVAAAVCANGRLYISDRTNHRVAVFNSIPLTNGANMDFVIGQTNFTTNTLVAASSSSFNLPYGVSCISNRLYVADRGNNRVVVYNPAPSSNVAASFAIGQPDLSSSTAGADYTMISNYLNNPGQVLYTGSQFFIVDIGNNRAIVYNALPVAAGASPQYVIGQLSSSGTTANQCGVCPAPPGQNTLSGPRAFAYRSGKLAIADTGNHRLTFYYLPISFNTPNATHQMGQPDFSTGTVPGTTAKGTFSSPKDMIFDGNFIWVQDAGNNRLQRLLLPF